METPTYSTIREAYDNTLKLIPKEKYKKMRSVAAMAEKALANAKNIEEINFYSTIFKIVGFERLLNKAKIAELAVMGIKDIKTLKTKLGFVGIESGLIVVGDPTNAYISEYDNKKIIQKMNQGEFFAFSTGGDGEFDITLRVIDIPEPLASPKEYKFIVTNSSTAIIKITSGKIKCSDFWDLGNEQKVGVEYELENGYYKICSYLKDIKNKYFGYLIVLSKISSFTPNTFRDFQTLA